MANKFLSGHIELSAVLEKMNSSAPDAVAFALTGIAFDIRKQVQQDLPQWVHLTRNFLPNMVVYERATATSLQARVGFDVRANFAMLLEQGGTRKPQHSSSLAIPVDARTNATGGISQANRPAAMMQKQNVYIKYEGGVMGMWQTGKRKGTPLKLLYVFKRSTKYTHHFLKFFDTATSVIQKTSQERFEAAIMKMLQK
jgi:hypothetical protein